jgi:hypothetical protein
MYVHTQLEAYYCSKNDCLDVCDHSALRFRLDHFQRSVGVNLIIIIITSTAKQKEAMVDDKKIEEARRIVLENDQSLYAKSTLGFAFA